ncbi:MAG: sulfur oxidation c-type cytochrome SoxX [Pseudomonadales bacterium]
MLAVAALATGVAAWAVAGAPAAATADGLLDFEVRGDAVPAALGGLIGAASRGRAIVIDRREGNCMICHHLPIEEQPFQGELGPPLDAVGARLSEGQIRLRLLDQSLLNPDTLMPPYYRVRGLTNVASEYRGQPALDAQQIEDVVAYLTTLKASP